MPRRARLDAPGVLHHVIVRGLERRKIFRDDQDREDFLERLGTLLIEMGLRCYAWALLPNHFHLLLRTGDRPLADFMRRLLTGYAVRFNLRNDRSGHLFQNRYRSILCQEEPYFLELVRYIHLNPLRAGVVANLKELETYPFCGHGVIVGTHRNDWQAVKEILERFGVSPAKARERYRDFVAKGVDQGKRPELVGGGLVRSLGGWQAVKTLRGAGQKLCGDERILGDAEFVEQVLKSAEERIGRRSRLEALGFTFERLAGRVAELFSMPVEEVLRKGRYPRTVLARSVLCFWANRELGMSTVDLGRRLDLAQPTVSQSIARGEKIVKEKGLAILPP